MVDRRCCPRIGVAVFQPVLGGMSVVASRRLPGLDHARTQPTLLTRPNSEVRPVPSPRAPAAPIARRNIRYGSCAPRETPVCPVGLSSAGLIENSPGELARTCAGRNCWRDVAADAPPIITHVARSSLAGGKVARASLGKTRSVTNNESRQLRAANNSELIPPNCL